ncbi:MAG: 2-C-methyl-D-erythritol 4-phosphate cytidylyltransferase [Candidatus Velthaea sp.]
MIWGAVVVAAGRGTRFGRPKQLLELGGKPMVAWSIETFASMPEVVDLVVVTEPEFLAVMQSVVAPRAGALGVCIVPGGSTRQNSVRAGLEALPEHCAGVLVHDGARPLVRAYEVRAGMRVVRPGTASLLAARVVDTVKAADSANKVTRTLDRSTLWAAQTPQFAATRDLQRAHADAVRLGWPAATDDAALLERAGVDVLVVEASPENFKVTVPGDLVRAEAILRERAAQPTDQEEILVVECFVGERAVDGVLSELESRRARIDAIDRDLPAAVAIRAYLTPDELRGFGRRLHALAGEDAVFTSHLSHVAARA